MRAIISRGLYISYTVFHCGLYSKAVSTTDNLCINQENSSILGLKIHGLSLTGFKSRADYNGACTVH
jgi:hypothetical protein